MDTTTLPPPAFSPFTPIDGFDTDVVVVGLGPAGATAALALATYGVRVHAVTISASKPRDSRDAACAAGVAAEQASETTTVW